MQIDEDSVRRAFDTPFGAELPGLMLNAVDGGVVFEVTVDGKVRQVPDRDAVLTFLNETCGWTPEHENAKGEEAPTAQVANPEEVGWSEVGWSDLVSM